MDNTEKSTEWCDVNHNRSFEEIVSLYRENPEAFDESDFIEMIRNAISLFLMDTDEKHPFKCSMAVESEEAFGLSSLDMPWIEEMWQVPGTGEIFFRMDYNNGAVLDFDHFSLYELISIADNLKYEV